MEGIEPGTVQRIDIDTLLAGMDSIPVADVRSPSEYARGHIPGAVNIPLFSDEERARVGTAYVKRSPEEARDLGMAIVLPKLPDLTGEFRNLCGSGPLILYCWRGGMRSASLAAHLAEVGFSPVMVLDGGYKAFRRRAGEYFSRPWTLRVLGGNTGSGKTGVLHELARLGAQVLDLEGLANHKGSAFGGLGQQPQPGTEHFENLVFRRLQGMDESRDLWVEDESISIGRVTVPGEFFRRMQESPLIYLENDVNSRIRLLQEEYGRHDASELLTALGAIERRLGRERHREAAEAITRGDLRRAAELCLAYYDKAYERSLGTRPAGSIRRIRPGGTGPGEIAAELLSLVAEDRQPHGKPAPEIIKLTSYSHGAGCGCKLSPAVLEEIVRLSGTGPVRDSAGSHPGLIVGNQHKDDAAVLDLGDGRGLISTTDFFMPIVDDPLLFGEIAAVNALSDIYAMGGSPVLALAILGWPIDRLPAEIAREVLEGGREACRRAAIPLAGGHSIDNPEPLFGLAVNGLVSLTDIKTNGGAKPGDILYLTKGIGTGILTTAAKNAALQSRHSGVAVESMRRINDIGSRLGGIPQVHALTDVTGFGLLGHLLEMCEASNVRAEIDCSAVPLLDGVENYLAQGQIPGGTIRNWKSYGHRVEIADKDRKQHLLLSDAQTSGGLLIAAAPEAAALLEGLLEKEGWHSRPIGRILAAGKADPKTPGQTPIRVLP